MSKFCSKCGNKLDEGVKYCPKCGNDVNGDTTWQEIAKSLEDKDFLYNQTLDKLLKF